MGIMQTDRLVGGRTNKDKSLSLCLHCINTQVCLTSIDVSNVSSFALNEAHLNFKQFGLILKGKCDSINKPNVFFKKSVTELPLDV